jgi:uncharacterized protein with NRDE domain
MCTLVLRFAPGTAAPVVVAANRDEALGREASGPALWPGERFVAPRDDEAGGTWLGLNADGVFVAVTNRFGVSREPDRESRGALVVEALRASSVHAIHARLASLPPSRFNAFHLLYADASEAAVTWSDGGSVQQQLLKPGFHIVTERSLGGDDRARTELIRAELGPWWQAPTPPPVEALMALLRLRNEKDPLGGTCVHVPTFDYGTRSSTVLVRAQPLVGSRYFACDTSPDVGEFVERRDLISSLAML